MPAHVTAVARTPWALRHTTLAGTRPEELLEAVLTGVLDRAGLDCRDVDRLLVACDESVGAQHHNIARRVAAEMGWHDLPGLTLDGGRTTGLATLALAADLPGRTIVAAVDMTTLIPPGAGLVRDYGRPEHAEPHGALLDRVARERGLDSDMLDRYAVTARARTGAPSPAIVPVAVPGGIVDADGIDTRPLDPEAPPVLDGGLQTANHLADLADGAVAVLVDAASSDENGRPIDAAGVEAGIDALAIAGRLAAERADRGAGVLVACASAVEGVLLEPAPPTEIASVPATGSTPSGDGLRLVADCFHLVPEPCRVIRGGDAGQVAWVDLGGG